MPEGEHTVEWELVAVLTGDRHTRSRCIGKLDGMAGAVNQAVSSAIRFEHVRRYTLICPSERTACATPPTHTCT